MLIFQMIILQMAIKKLKCINDLEEFLHVEEVDELQDEMLDRFGEYPDEVSYLFLISEMKVYANQ